MHCRDITSHRRPFPSATGRTRPRGSSGGRGPTAERSRLDRDDATRDGAYSLALAAVEAEAGWVALGRAETRTGADYYVGFTDAPDYEDAYRLEVSGIDEGDAPQIEYRLTQKLKQAREGQSDLPALACVVGFRSRRIAIETAEEP